MQIPGLMYVRGGDIVVVTDGGGNFDNTDFRDVSLSSSTNGGGGGNGPAEVDIDAGWTFGTNAFGLDRTVSIRTTSDHIIVVSTTATTIAAVIVWERYCG